MKRDQEYDYCGNPVPSIHDAASIEHYELLVAQHQRDLEFGDFIRRVIEFQPVPKPQPEKSVQLPPTFGEYRNGRE